MSYNLLGVVTPGIIHLEALRNISGVIPGVSGNETAMPGNLLEYVADQWFRIFGLIGSRYWPQQTELGDAMAVGQVCTSPPLRPRTHRINDMIESTASAWLYFPARMILPVVNTSNFPC